MPIEQQLEEIRATIAKAAKQSGRGLDDVRLIAVTKKQGIEAIYEALAAGLEEFGESKVQEARSKIPRLGRGRWHMIGHLQKNKVRWAVQLFDRIDSVDSIELAQEISKCAAASGKHLPVLMEVNIAGESQKFGVSPSQTCESAEKINELSHLELYGLMGMAPYVCDPEQTRPFFARLRECRDRIEQSTGLHLPELSMGMSHDFAIAIEEGSTEIRLGTALFGTRKKA